jgi:L-iditol 2-dehydrogenase
MLAAFFTGHEQFDLREIDKFECPPRGLLVKVNACSICGTDLKILHRADVKMERGKKRSMPLPRIIGHEFSGTVEKTNRERDEFTVGEGVVVAPTVPCMNCRMCERGFYEMCDNLMVVGYDCDGGFAQYCAVESRIVDSDCVLKVGDTDDLDLFALAEPLSCVVNCLELSPVREEDTVVVIGSGPVGCFITELARIHGAGRTVLVGRSHEKLDLAVVCGADIMINGSESDAVQEVLDVTDGNGAEVVITACSSQQAQHDALYFVAKKGSINFFGGLPRNGSVVSLDTNLVHYKECVITGTHGSRPGHVKEAIRLIRDGSINMKKYISHCFALRDINRAFEQVFSRNRMKVLVKP